MSKTTPEARKAGCDANNSWLCRSVSSVRPFEREGCDSGTSESGSYSLRCELSPRPLKLDWEDMQPVTDALPSAGVELDLAVAPNPIAVGVSGSNSDPE